MGQTDFLFNMFLVLFSFSFWSISGCLSSPRHFSAPQGLSFRFVIASVSLFFWHWTRSAPCPPSLPSSPLLSIHTLPPSLPSFSVYFQSLRIDMLESLSFFMTLATAISKSSCVTCILRSRKANMPASVQTALHSAPEAFGIFSAIPFK